MKCAGELPDGDSSYDLNTSIHPNNEFIDNPLFRCIFFFLSRLFSADLKTIIAAAILYVLFAPPCGIS